MTWKDCDAFLKTEYRRFRGFETADVFLPIRERDKFQSEMERLQSENLVQLNEAIREFANKGRWPRLTPVAKYLLRRRIGFARYIVELMMTNAVSKHPQFVSFPVVGPPNPEVNRPLMIEWLLITVWLVLGHLDWWRGLDGEYQDLIRRKGDVRTGSPEAFAS